MQRWGGGGASLLLSVTLWLQVVVGFLLVEGKVNKPFTVHCVTLPAEPRALLAEGPPLPRP
jgi:hypothetical protein